MRLARDKHRKVNASVDLTPLIDVVFQLLLFFMLSSTFIVQSSIPIDMAESTNSEQSEKENCTITVSAEGTGGPDAQGDIFIKDPSMTDAVAIESWEQLTTKLEELKASNPEALVLINPDKKVPYQRLVNVLDSARKAKISNYGLSVKGADEGTPDSADASIPLATPTGGGTPAITKTTDVAAP